MAPTNTTADDYHRLGMAEKPVEFLYFRQKWLAEPEIHDFAEQTANRPRYGIATTRDPLRGFGGPIRAHRRKARPNRGG